MKKLTLLLSFLFLAVTGAYGQESNFANFNVAYDVDSTSATYCRVLGANGNPYGPPIQGQAQIETVGSNTTVTAVTASTVPFALLDVGDVVFVRYPTGSTDTRIIIAKASGDSVTVNSAINLDIDGGYAFTWKNTVCGTAITDGWIDVSGSASTSFTIQYDQGDLGSFDARIECKGSFNEPQPVQVFPTCTAGACNTFQSYTTVGIASRTTYVVVDPSYSSCRVAVKYTTSDASDAGANLESVTVGLTRSTAAPR